MTKYSIQPTAQGCALTLTERHTAANLPLPISPDDAKALIEAAFRSPMEQPRAELHGVLADRTETGVRVHIVARAGYFDIPWEHLARGVEVAA